MIRRVAHSTSGTAVLPTRRPPLLPPPQPVEPPPQPPGWGSRLRWTVVFGAVFAGLVWVTGSLLSVLIASAVIAYLLDPVVTRIERRGYSREGAIFAVGAVTAIALLIALGVVVPGLARKVGEVGGQVTPYLTGFESRVEPLLREVETRFGVVVPTDLRALASELPSYLQKLSPDARKTIQDWLGRIAGGGMDVVLSALTVSLLPVFTFYLLRDWPLMVAWVDDLVPARHRPTVRAIATEIDGRIGSFVKGQLTVAAVLAGIYTVGLLVAGVDLAITLGLLSGALFLLPYLGLILSGTLCVALVLLEHGFDWHVLAVLGTFGVAQLLEGTFLTPMLVGDRVGLHPLVVMIALIVAGNLLGMWGLVVALPVTAAIAVVGSHVLDTYRKSRTYLG